MNADASNWEDIFIEDEDSEEETKRSTFSRWEIKDEILLSMMLAVRTSVYSSYINNIIAIVSFLLSLFACNSHQSNRPIPLINN